MYCCLFLVVSYRNILVYAVGDVLWRNIDICTGGCSKCIMIVSFVISYRASYTLPCVYSIISIDICMIYTVVGSRIPAKVS